MSTCPRLPGLGFRVWGLGFRVHGAGDNVDVSTLAWFGVSGSQFSVQSEWLRVQGSEFNRDDQMHAVYRG